MILFSFFLALLALILQGVLIPKIPILAMSPFLSLIILKEPFEKALCLSVAAGVVMDLLSDDPMGIHALNYAILAWILLRVKRHFSYDQPHHLSLFTALLSSLSTLLHWFLLFLFDRRDPLIGRWIFTAAMIDALYAFVWFAAPLALFSKIHRLWLVFWLKRKNRYLTSR